MAKPEGNTVTNEYATLLNEPEAQPPEHGLPSPLRQPAPVWRMRVVLAWHALYNLIFPPRCASCGRADVEWCDRCQRLLHAVPISLHITTPPSPYVLRVASTATHTDKVRHAIHALKYTAVPALHVPLGARLAAALHTLAWDVDLIVPVPMHANKLAQRGYNQSGLLAESLAAAADLPCTPDVVRRVHYRRAQVGLNARERQENVADAFSAVGQGAMGKRVLVVDDVYTTGATLAACAAALHQAGAAAVYGLTVSTASGGTTGRDSALDSLRD